MEVSANATKINITQSSVQELGKAVITTEAKAIASLADRIDEKFTKACELLLNCQGRTIIIGIGKSGHIGRKIAATLASIGTPAHFVHPSEASHGDMGMITAKDVVIGISNSGETYELINVIAQIKRLKIPVIALTGNLNSTLAKNANVSLDVSVSEEACPLGLAPTASTTATLVMGDALAIALLDARGFTKQDFANIHPGGSLGKRLLLHIDSLMYAGSAMPKVHQEISLSEALIEITSKSLGMTTIVDDNGVLQGIFTDGDLRRVLNTGKDIHQIKMTDIMTPGCKTIRPGLLAADALQIMEQHKITALIVVDENNKPIGVVHMHSLLQAGVV
ncbi:MAG: KpsF/GutQ family sugar-phosphate isomerase [Gammaproteobacteria bacterium]|nr:KpsF/GutQ family sugar-phosphate isomerase [Gammaproteobacteria bacterium]